MKFRKWEHYKVRDINAERELLVNAFDQQVMKCEVAYQKCIDERVKIKSFGKWLADGLTGKGFNI